MFQNIGNFTTYLIILGIGIALLLSYYKKKQSAKLWSGIGFILAGMIFLVISFYNVNSNINKTPIASVVNSSEDATTIISDYKNIINNLLIKSDTTKSDTLVRFFEFNINLPMNVVFDNRLEEPIILFKDSITDLFIDFKKESKQNHESLLEFSNATVDFIKNNNFGPQYIIDNGKSVIDNKLIQYDYSKINKGVEIENGQLMFVNTGANIIRISISRMGKSTTLIEKYVVVIKDEIKNNLFLLYL